MQLEDHDDGNDTHTALRVHTSPSTAYQQVRNSAVAAAPQLSFLQYELKSNSRPTRISQSSFALSFQHVCLVSRYFNLHVVGGVFDDETGAADDEGNGGDERRGSEARLAAHRGPR